MVVNLIGGQMITSNLIYCNCYSVKDVKCGDWSEYKTFVEMVEALAYCIDENEEGYSVEMVEAYKNITDFYDLNEYLNNYIYQGYEIPYIIEISNEYDIVAKVYLNK